MRIHSWGFPRCGTTYLMYALADVYALEPEARFDEPLHWSDDDGSLVGKPPIDIRRRLMRLEFIHDEVQDQPRAMVKHHHEHGWCLKHQHPDMWKDYVDLFDYNIFLFRSNQIYRSISNAIQTGYALKVDRKRYRIPVTQFVKLCISYIESLIYAGLISDDVVYDEVVCYESMPTDPMELANWLNISDVYPLQRTNRVRPHLIYKEKNWEQDCENYDELVAALREAQKPYQELIPQLFDGLHINTRYLEDRLSK